MNAITANEFAPPAAISGPRSKALIFGLLGLAATGAGFAMDHHHFFQAYLIAYVTWITVALGCLGLMMLHHLSGGAWGLMVRRQLEAAAGTLPLLAVLFIPIALGMDSLYHWTDTVAVAADPILTNKSGYLNRDFFLVRTVLYFVIWCFLAWRLRSLSAQQDATGDPRLFKQLQGWSAVGFLLLALTMTFASVDWVMSLDPHWFSSLYGLWFFTGAGLSGLAFTILVANWSAGHEPMSKVLVRSHFHDYGKLLFAFTMLWAYLAFSQMLLIWSGNLPEEITFYLPRMRGVWTVASVFLLLGHFILPFLILLSASLKQRRNRLMQVAAWLMVMRWFDYYWNVVPTLQAHHGEFHPFQGVWIDIAAVVGLGGVWLWFFWGNLAKRPMLPINDPFLAETLGYD
ncbi:MAG: hypothetical protein K8J08_10325 [Thermoanaerobaculia bacterium]|nr:hypothetical protein [Thermoanaerobaculia bacterium]